MSVKVIELEKPFYGRCDYCGTIFTYTAGDMYSYEGNNEDLFAVRCPNCDRDVSNIWHSKPENQRYLY